MSIPRTVGYDAHRTNNASRANCKPYDLQHPFASGAFRWVAKGKYTRGANKGKPCVFKWFQDVNTQNIYQERFFAEDIKAVDKSVEIVDMFNKENIIQLPVKMCIPAVFKWAMDGYEDHKKGTLCLVEPFIENFQKFNSNSGWVATGVPWVNVMQALSHYSYHVRGGQYLLCDLQGAIENDAIVLTDPVIHSMSEEYGLTDLGRMGIETFFHRHSCTRFCNNSWTQPNRTGNFVELQEGTTMQA